MYVHLTDLSGYKGETEESVTLRKEAERMLHRTIRPGVNNFDTALAFGYALLPAASANCDDAPARRFRRL